MTNDSGGLPAKSAADDLRAAFGSPEFPRPVASTPISSTQTEAGPAPVSDSASATPEPQASTAVSQMSGVELPSLEAEPASQAGPQSSGAAPQPSPAGQAGPQRGYTAPQQGNGAQPATGASQPGFDAPSVEGGSMKTMNKHVFVWVMSFLLGCLGVDRFVRGQIGLGVLKLLVGWMTCGVWWLVDWIIAMVKAYGSAFGAQDDLVFVGGKYAR